MIYFNCDYLEGGHPKILERMMETNMEQLTGYSTDHYCDSAREKIRRACGREDADVHFLVGGTQTNLIAIASILKPYQGVLAAHDGHIACHETGAIEATGHKVLPVPCVVIMMDPDEALFMRLTQARVSAPCWRAGLIVSSQGRAALYALHGAHALALLDVQRQKHKADQQRKKYDRPAVVAHKGVDALQDGDEKSVDASHLI